MEKINIIFDLSQAVWKGTVLNDNSDPKMIIFFFLRHLDYIIEDIVRKTRPASYLVCLIDDYPPYKRKKVFHDYKKKRKKNEKIITNKQIIRDYLKSENINIICSEGYEADDVVCGVIKRNEGINIIVAEDGDLFQLLSSRTCMYKKKNIFTIFDLRDMGFTPLSFLLQKVFGGCTSDKVPGIRGITDPTLLKKSTHLHKIIKPTKSIKTKMIEFYEKGEYQRNMKLIKLPYDWKFGIDTCAIDLDNSSMLERLIENRFTFISQITKV